MAELFHPDPEHPWPWLDPFRETAKEFFNGRDDDALALLRGVLNTPVCVLYGKSGLGKTSLLGAGLFPLLRERQMLPVPLRRLSIGESAPGLSTQLLRALDEAVAASTTTLGWMAITGTAPAADEPTDDVARLWERLHDRSLRLQDSDGHRWSPVFVLDQFEEIFTLQPDEKARRKAFQELGDLLENRMPPTVARRLDDSARHAPGEALIDRIDPDLQAARYLIALREDFLPELEVWTDLIPRLGPNRVRLLPMAPTQALDAVQKTGGALVDASSAQNIVDFLGRQTVPAGPGRVLRENRRIEPALLSLVCASLNAERLARQPPGARLDVDDLEKRGAQILDRFYDEAFEALPEDLRAAAAAWVESDLITEGGTRRPYPLAAVAAALRPALAPLIDHRLLRIQITEQGDQIELVHDRLAAVAQQRAAAEAQRIEAAERLRRENEATRVKAASERARAAESAEKAERRRAEDAEAEAYRERTLRKRMWVFGICAAALAVLCLIVTSIAWNQRTKILEASANELSANLERIKAENATLTALASASKALKAVEAAKENASDMAKIRDLIVAANSEYQTARQQSDTSICPAGRRVYAHVSGAAEANWLERPLQALKGAGFIVPDTEIVAAQKLPSRTELRYFRRNEESGALAALAVLSQAGLDGVVARYVPGYEDSQRIRLCHYELWMATRQ